MSPRILIITNTGDTHSIAVAEALSSLGCEATLWVTSDFPTRSEETLHFKHESATEFRIEGAGFNLSNPVFDVVWRRRPAYVLNSDDLHPADREFANSECGIFRSSFVSLLSPQAFWINP